MDVINGRPLIGKNVVGNVKIGVKSSSYNFERHNLYFQMYSGTKGKLNSRINRREQAR